MYFDGLNHKTEVESHHKSTVWGFLPIKTDCPDCAQETLLTGGARDINCSTCGGLGYTVTWRQMSFLCHVIWTDPVGITMIHGVITTAAMGDCLLYGTYEQKDSFKEIKETADAYILVDDEKLAVSSIAPVRVGDKKVSIEVRCETMKVNE